MVSLSQNKGFQNDSFDFILYTVQDLKIYICGLLTNAICNVHGGPGWIQGHGERDELINASQSGQGFTQMTMIMNVFTIMYVTEANMTELHL